MERFVAINMPRAFAADSLTTTWAMNHYTEISGELSTKFNNIGYEKSACIFRMFQNAMTIPTFTKGLKNYYRKMQFKAAVPEDIYESLQWAYDEDFPGNDWNIGELHNTWASQPGYPLVSVEKHENRFVFSQRRFPLNNGEIYAIPLTFSTQSGSGFEETRPKAWMTEQTLTMSMVDANFTEGDWIILNNQQLGYYRADYSTELWREIISQLRSDHEVIHKINRAVLLVSKKCYKKTKTRGGSQVK